MSPNPGIGAGGGAFGGAGAALAATGGAGGGAFGGGGAAGFFATVAGRPGATTGRSPSSSEPSAAGKSEGTGARAAVAGGAGEGAGGGGGAGAAVAGATPSIVFAAARIPSGFVGWFTGPGFAAGGGGGAPPPGLATTNECPHFGQRIFKPVAGIRRSSIWYGALHDSHSTFSIYARA
jgi:hypothetical protein